MPKKTNPLRSFTAKKAKRSKENEPIQLSSLETEVLLMSLLGLLLCRNGWTAFQSIGTGTNYIASAAAVKSLWNLGLLDANFPDDRVFDCAFEFSDVVALEAMRTTFGPPLLLVWANQRAAEVIHGSSATTKKAVH
jgi:hypothetical protein